MQVVDAVREREREKARGKERERERVCVCVYSNCEIVARYRSTIAGVFLFGMRIKKMKKGHGHHGHPL